MRRDIFQGITDPTLRATIALVASQVMTPCTLSENFHTSRQAISKQIKVLNEYGILSYKQIGREIYYEVQAKKLKEVSDWIEPFKAMWETKFRPAYKPFLSKKVKIVRSYNAPLNDVWRAWPESGLLDLLWAPMPSRAKTKTMIFTAGGKSRFKTRQQHAYLFGARDRLEAKRLFDTLSKNGLVTMPLEDMFFGAYFGEFTDKFVMNWIVNCTE